MRKFSEELRYAERCKNLYHVSSYFPTQQQHQQTPEQLFHSLVRLATQQMSQMGYSTIRPSQAKTTRDYLLLKDMIACPELFAHYTEEALIVDRHLHGQYDYRSELAESITLRGEAAVRLYSSLLVPSLSSSPSPPPKSPPSPLSAIKSGIRLDITTLVAFAPFWIDGRVIGQFPAWTVPEVQENVRAMWTALPPLSPPQPVSETLEFDPQRVPDDDLELVDLSDASFWDCVRQLLLPLIWHAQQHPQADRQMFTAALLSLLVSSDVLKHQRRILVAARSKSTQRICGLAHGFFSVAAAAESPLFVAVGVQADAHALHRWNNMGATLATHVGQWIQERLAESLPKPIAPQTQCCLTALSMQNQFLEWLKFQRPDLVVTPYVIQDETSVQWNAATVNAGQPPVYVDVLIQGPIAALCSICQAKLMTGATQ